MEDKKLIINENKTPFSVFEKRIDYSLVKNHKKSNKLNLKKLWSKIAIGFCSLLLLIGGGILCNELYNIHVQTLCPFKEGTYYYVRHEGDLGDLDFDEKSYIVLTSEEVDDEGTFSITNKKELWIIYGTFFNCEFNNMIHTKFLYMENNYVLEYKIKILNDKTNNLILNISDGTNNILIKFQLDTE